MLNHTSLYGTNEFIIVNFDYALGGAWFSQEHEYSTWLESQGGHSIVKLNTKCEQSLLPLYYMP